MEPFLVILALLGLFSATHIGLATRPLRTPLVAHLGERGFVLLFSGVAAVSFSALIVGFSRLRFLGAPGPGLGSIPVLGAVLGLMAGLGIVLMLASFATYTSSPMAANPISIPTSPAPKISAVPVPRHLSGNCSAERSTIDGKMKQWPAPMSSPGKTSCPCDRIPIRQTRPAKSSSKPPNSVRLRPKC